MSNSQNRCTVRQRIVTLEDIKKVLNKQGNICKPNERKGSEDAFSKTLRGSKIYLKEQGKLN